MGRKLNTTQAVVVDVLLPQLTEMFRIEPQGTFAATEQWFYANDGSYVPDRTISPLILVPTLYVVDPDIEQMYQPSFMHVTWFRLNESTGKYDIEITSTNTSDDYYILANGNLVVRKNVAYDASVSLLCSLTYIDPRDATVTHDVTETITLCTNRDASIITPTVVIDCLDGDSFNVITDAADSQFTLNAKVLLNGEDITSTSSIRWYAVENGGAETLIDATASDGFAQFPCYVSGQNTSALVVDMMYSNQISIIARVLNTATNALYPTKDHFTIVWDNFSVDGIATTQNSGAVRTNTTEMTFDVIVNMHERTWTESEKKANLFINWRRRIAVGGTGTATVHDAGWGQQIKVDGTTLRTYNSTAIYAELNLASAYEKVYDSGTVVTDNGECVYDRPI